MSEQPLEARPASWWRIILSHFPVCPESRGQKKKTPDCHTLAYVPIRSCMDTDGWWTLSRTVVMTNNGDNIQPYPPAWNQDPKVHLR